MLVARIVTAGSRLFPGSLVPPAVPSFFAPRLQRATLYIPPLAYSRFATALLVYPGLAQLTSLVLLPPPLPLLPVALLALVQLLPFAIVSFMASKRRHGVEAELPFVAMLLYVLSHESFPGLREAFNRIGSLGRDVFPAFTTESQVLDRNLTYSTGPEMSTIEETFDAHPSVVFREFLHGYLRTLASGIDLHDYLRVESERLTSLLEERWRTYSVMVSSVTEIAFIFLAVFPIGMQMIAGALLSGSSSDLLLESVLLLTGVTTAIVLWLDYAQPALHDGGYPLSAVALVCACLGGFLGLYFVHFFGPVEAALSSLAVSSAFVAYSRSFFRDLRSGEREIVWMLHDLAEGARSGTSLPAVLSRLRDNPARYPSLGSSISSFVMALSLGKSPRQAQRGVRHPSWLVRVSFGLLAVSFETGSGYEQLDRLSLSFRRMWDAKRSIQSSVLPFAVLGAAVPVISVASYWFLSNMQGLSLLVPGLSASGGSISIMTSVLASSVLTGFIVSKAYSFSFRSFVGIPPILVAALVSFIFFGFV